LNEAGVDGCFYWYANNWHFLRQWHHLKQMKAAARLPIQTYDRQPDFSEVHLPQSDAIMARTICMQIKLSWSDAQIQERIAKIEQVLKTI
jgi:8-amino-3,8-dideoxy-alpha-D-manno-octulosonate transaminase